MTTKNLASRIRLLPVVMLVAGGLLAVKGLDLVQDAHAESAAPAASGAAQAGAQPADNAQPAKSKPNDHDAAADAVLDSNSDSAAEVDVLTSLAHRRDELDARAKALDMRATLLQAAEKRVDAKIADLKSLEGQIQTLLGHRDDAEKKQVAALVKVYSSMKPRDAARIFNTLNEQVLLDVAQAMKPDALAAIMAAMQPSEAQDLTVKLANRLKLPTKPDLPSAAALASTASPPPPPPGG